MNWISVKDKLPEYGVEVIGSFGHFVDFMEYVDGACESWFYWINDRNEQCEPTHWMLSPKPFEE